jgi:hypothetical protein
MILRFLFYFGCCFIQLKYSESMQSEYLLRGKLEKLDFIFLAYFSKIVTMAPRKSLVLVKSSRHTIENR